MPMRPLDSGRVRSHSMVAAPSSRLVAKGIKIALRIAASADILNDDVVAVARKPHRVRVDDSRRDVAAIGLAHEQRRVRPGSAGIVMIGDKVDAIGHAAADAAFERYAVAESIKLGPSGRGIREAKHGLERCRELVAA